MSWIKIVEGKRTLKQQLIFFGIVLFLVLAFVGLVWGGILGWLAVGITFILLSYVFWCIDQKCSVFGADSPQKFIAGFCRNPKIIFLNAIKGFEQYVKPIPRPPDQKPRSIGGPLPYVVFGIVVLVLVMLIGVVLLVGTSVAGLPLLAGALPCAFIIIAIYCALSVPRRPRPVSVSTIRLSLAFLSFGIPIAMWFWLGIIAVFQIPSGMKPWHLLAIPGLLLPVAIFGVPAHLSHCKRRHYISFPEDSSSSYSEANPFREFRDRVNMWSQTLGVQDPPVMLLSTIRGLSPHVFGWRKAYLAVPVNLPEIMTKIQKAWPAQAEALLDFMALHELTHIVHNDYRLLIWLRSFSSLVFPLFVPSAFALSILGSYVFLPQASWRLLLVLIILLPLMVGLYLMTFVQLLLVNREREFLADQRAMEMLGPDGASALRERVADRSPLSCFFSLFSSAPGSSPGEVLFHDCVSGSPLMGLGRIRSWIARGFWNLTQTHPSVERREALLGHAYDVERLFMPREHGVVTGLTVASIWFTFLVAGYALGYRELWTLDFVLFWICLMVLVGIIVVPLRNMGGRFVELSVLFRHIWQSYAWSMVTAVVAIQAMALIPMIITGEWQLFENFLVQMIIVHIVAVLIAWIFIPRLKEMGAITTSTKDHLRGQK